MYKGKEKSLALIDEVEMFNYELPATEILKQFQEVASNDKLISLLANWKLQNGSGTIALDATPNQQHGTIRNAQSNQNGTGWTTLNGTRCFTFDGLDDYIDTSVPNGAYRTLAAWIRPNSSDDVYFIESVFDSDIPMQYGSGWGLDNGYIKVILDDQCCETNQAVELNKWQHVALTISPTEARLYVNGSLTKTHTYVQGPLTPEPYRIGASKANQLFVDGTISYARIYIPALPAITISAMQ